MYYQWIGFWIEVTIPMAVVGVIASLLMIYYPITEFLDGVRTVHRP